MTSLSDFRCALQNPEFPNGISHIRCHRTVFPSGKFGIFVIPTTGEHHIRLNIFTVGNMRVMICLGQGGLRSLSASSFSNVADLSYTLSNHCIVAYDPFSRYLIGSFKSILPIYANLTHLRAF